MGSADLQSPQKLVAAFNACNVKQQVDGPGSDLGPVLCVGLNGVQHLFFIFVTTYLVMEHVRTIQDRPGNGTPDSVLCGTWLLLPPLSTSYFVRWNVCETTQGGLKEPKELQWPLQSPERHDAALGRFSAGERVCQGWPPDQT